MLAPARASLALALAALSAFACGGGGDGPGAEPGDDPDAAQLPTPSQGDGQAARGNDAGATGGADAGGGADDAGPDDASADAADGGADAAPPGTTRPVFTYNVCGADDGCKVANPIAAVLEQVERLRPAAFVLQELCEGQANALSSALRARNLPYAQRFRNASSKFVNLGCGGPEGWGNAVFHAGARLGEVVEGEFAAQGPLLSRAQNRGYVCVRVPSPAFWACSTHIDVAAEQQKAQIDELARVARSLTTRGGPRVPVVVGGDFNVAPGSDRLDGMFATSYARGAGALLERDVRADRTFAPAAATHGAQKIDYLFRTPDVDATGGSVLAATSDHRLVVNTLVFR